ncbi:copper-binding protein [Pseudomonas sp. BAY1663]|uniref:heavy-metal-associated domain-containing protein n=1 Tax=Pseudomonas sp. BAY1663 TaxID=1439940 RepID=UPI00042E0443|nr:heavy-metal-associated domain-containing protein [Pseudomonas sp. BAY1663]EXF44540.1 copper-binding protein [Pseudomonas sp. BAY1663]
MNTSTLKVFGMSCGACARHVCEALEPLAGVTTVDVDLAAGLVRIVGTATRDALIAALDTAGYPAEAVADAPPRKTACGASAGCCCH